MEQIIANDMLRIQ